MTDLETHEPVTVPGGKTVRPVRRFVVAQLVLAVLFGALWWSGLVAPRLSLGSTSSGFYNTINGQATIDLVLHNDSMGPVEVRRVGPDQGWMKVVSVHVNGVDIAREAQRIAAGDEATLKLEFACRPTPGEEPLAAGGPAERASIRLEITVRSPIGFERTRTTRGVDVPTACFG